MAQYIYAQRQVRGLERHFHKFSPDSHGGYQLCIEGYQLRSPRLLIFCCVMLLGGYCSQFQRSLSMGTDSDGFIFVSVPCFEKCIVAVLQCIRQVSVPRARCARYQTVSIHSKPPQQPHGKIDKTFGAEQKQSRFYSKWKHHIAGTTRGKSELDTFTFQHLSS